MDDNIFGKILKNIRYDLNLSQEEFARKLNTTKQVISRYETGQRIPKITTLAEYAEILGLPISAFWEDKTPTAPAAKVVTVPAAENKYKRITDTLDTMNEAGVYEVEKFTEYTATRPEYKKPGESEVLLTKEEA